MAKELIAVLALTATINTSATIPTEPPTAEIIHIGLTDTLLTAEVIATQEEAERQAEIAAEAAEYNDELEYIAKTIYGEIGGGTDEEKAQVAWCILNRVDDVGNGFRDTIRGVVTQSGQFHGYNFCHPVTDANYKIAKDVVYRWIAEKHGVEIERELPSGYCWFSGYGGHNHFRNVY